MKTIGLIGGMSWESTLEYYRHINEAVKERLGGLHSAKIRLYSVDFAEYEAWMAQGNWDAIAEALSAAACSLEAAGADFVAICTNTMHLVADRVQAAIRIPLLHIADATADAVRTQGLRKMVLLGTSITMQRPFFRERLERLGIEVLVPEAPVAQHINQVIFEELCLGILSKNSREAFVQAIRTLETRGAQGVILGCTEIGLLVRPEDSPLPVFDTLRVHAEKVASIAMEQEA